MTRTFTIHSISTGNCRRRLGSYTGHFDSATPVGAAKKAMTSLRKKDSKVTSAHIEVRETTRNGPGKIHSYNVKTMKLAKPIMLKNREIKHRSVAKATNKMLSKSTKECKSSKRSRSHSRSSHHTSKRR